MREAIGFVVEQAGCESCAARVRSALAELLEIEEIAVDESADVAIVRARAPRKLARTTVDAALAAVSVDGEHTYRVRPDSWPAA